MTALTGRVALLTGASGGIGKGIARALAEEGVDLFLTYGRNGGDAEEAAPTRAASAGAPSSHRRT